MSTLIHLNDARRRHRPDTIPLTWEVRITTDAGDRHANLAVVEREHGQLHGVRVSNSLWYRAHYADDAAHTVGIIIHNADQYILGQHALQHTLGLLVQTAFAHDTESGHGKSSVIHRRNQLFNEHIHPWLRVFDKRRLPPEVLHALRRRERLTHTR